MIESYMIVRQETLQFLVEAVNECIEKGWQPFGSMTFVPTFSDNSGKLYVQPMVKHTPL